jgi:hypothetical protein
MVMISIFFKRPVRSTGIPGVIGSSGIGFAALVAALALPARRALRGPHRALAGAALGVLAAGLAVAVVQSYLYSVGNIATLPLWICAFVGASLGGLVGIAFAAPSLREDGRDEEETPLAALVAHVRYAADRIGAEHVALGSDFDGATIPAELGDVTGLPKLLGALAAAGFAEPELRAIAWGNWRRVLERAWGG